MSGNDRAALVVVVAWRVTIVPHVLKYIYFAKGRRKISKYKVIITIISIISFLQKHSRQFLHSANEKKHSYYNTNTVT